MGLKVTPVSPEEAEKLAKKSPKASEQTPASEVPTPQDTVVDATKAVGGAASLAATITGARTVLPPGLAAIPEAGNAIWGFVSNMVKGRPGCAVSRLVTGAAGTVAAGFAGGPGAEVVDTAIHVGGRALGADPSALPDSATTSMVEGVSGLVQGAQARKEEARKEAAGAKAEPSAKKIWAPTPGM